MEFQCIHENCPYKKGLQPYVLTLPQEACVDEHNCATLFCPHCQRELVKKVAVD